MPYSRVDTDQVRPDSGGFLDYLGFGSTSPGATPEMLPIGIKSGALRVLNTIGQRAIHVDAPEMPHCETVQR
ncbi:MAG: hypothetical protein WCA28_06540 [Bradyrhizobium sp.]